MSDGGVGGEGVTIVHGERGVGQRDGPALSVVRAEQRRISDAVVDRRNLPTKVMRVLQPGVHAEPPSRRELVRRVADEVDAADGQPIGDVGHHRPASARTERDLEGLADGRGDLSNDLRVIIRVVALESGEEWQLRHPLAIAITAAAAAKPAADGVSDYDGDRLGREGEVQHRVGDAARAESATELRRAEVHRVEVLERRRPSHLHSDRAAGQ